ncbi:hypothetical protein ACMZOO_11395 [Catenovulum sp. SX2]|uniref:RIFT barrel domain-containing protein n=1 Tax=Catenovulum sp. SX2 TaxID=3398614 RepID=UPI003F82CE6F
MNPSLNISFSLTEHLGIARNNQICRFSVPFKQGQVTSIEHIGIQNQAGEFVTCSKQVLAHWPDNSIKWLSLEFFATIAATQSEQWAVVVADSFAEQEAALQPELEDTAPVLHSVRLKLKDYPLVEMPIEWHNSTTTQISTSFDTSLVLPTDQRIKLNLSKKSYQQNGDTLYSATLLNARAATHAGGLWDLGDSASIEIEYCELVFLKNEKQLSVIELADEKTLNLGQDIARVVQVASGGENWQSPVHLDKNLQVPLKQNGALVYGADGQWENLATARLNPSVKCADTFIIQPQQFWQNFPKGLALTDNKIVVELLPKCDYLHELQAGEQTTLQVSCYNQQNKTDFVSQALTIQVDLTHVQNSQVWPYFYQAQELSPIESIIQRGVNGASNFFAKREVVDEYGWRNFGDLYADHETDGYQGEDIFVSHYNNQYDPIYGFLRQWTLTQDSRWLELAQDLAKHVKDIDIYHTDLDKAEYNHGLFWHTDHYLPAKTATHRTYSKHHEQGAYMDHAGGGGPGGQHCYTTGLMYHYFLTGDETSKQTVLNLAKWIGHIYDGEGGLLEAVLAVKNAGQAGFTNLVTGQYPLDRGVGNFVIALLDAYQLTNDKSYLNKASSVLHKTIHPTEDLTLRDLSNVEYAWFYTVLLQAACRYLAIKEQASELDSEFYYVRDALLHYAQWMEQNEYPYLHKPEILEYPNQTWTAQDMRKANVLACAAYYAPDSDMANKFWHKALYFYQYVADTLGNDPTTHYTRILVLLAQNHGVIEYFTHNKPEDKFAAIQSYTQPNWHNTPAKIARIIKLFATRLVKISISREVNWLAKRSAKAAKILGKEAKQENK